MKPAGIWDGPPPPDAMAVPIRLRLGSPSWRSMPFGPIREKRNGGAGACAVTASVAARPFVLSLSSPSPSTK